MARASGRLARSRSRCRLALTVQYAVEKDGLPTRSQLRAWAKSALLRDAMVTVRLVDAGEGRTLNRQYRGRMAPPTYSLLPTTEPAHCLVISDCAFR